MSARSARNYRAKSLTEEEIFDKLNEDSDVGLDLDEEASDETSRSNCFWTFPTM